MPATLRTRFSKLRLSLSRSHRSNKTANVETLGGPYFSKLPAELKIQIFDEVYHNRNADLLAILSVCEDWNELAMPILWRNIPIHNYNIMYFVRSVQGARQSTCDLVRNLSVHIYAPPYGRKEGPKSILGYPASELSPVYEEALGPDDDERTKYKLLRLEIPSFLETSNCSSEDSLHEQRDEPEWWLLLTALLALLDLVKDRFSNLKSSSLRFERECHPNEDTNLLDILLVVLPRRVIIRYLRCLPNSCVDVELDDAGLSYQDRPQVSFHGNSDHRNSTGEAEMHFCPHIANLLSRLHHLQLKLGDLCPLALGFDLDGEAPQLSDTTFSATSKLQSLHININPSPIYAWWWSATCWARKAFKLAEVYDANMRRAEGVASVVRHQNIFAHCLRGAYEAGAYPSIKRMKLVGWHSAYDSKEAHFSVLDIPNSTRQRLPRSEIGIVLADGTECYTVKLGTARVDEELADDGWITTTNGLRFPKCTETAKECQWRRLEVVDPLTLCASEADVQAWADERFFYNGSLAGELQSLRLRPPVLYEGLEEDVLMSNS